MIIKKINTMFHKHSRWLFGAFTIVIIVSFMGFLTPGQFGLDMFSDPANTRVGTAFGEPVTYGDLITEAERLQSLSLAVASLVLSFWSVSCIRKGEPNED